MHHSLIKKIKNNQGFTLVEVAVIAPFMIIVVVGMLAVLITLITNNSTAGGKLNLTYEVQSASNNIQSNVRSASALLTTQSGGFTDNYAPPGGWDYTKDGTASTANNSLILNSYDYIIDPTNNRRTIPAFKGASGADCDSKAAILPTNIIYFIKDSTLYQRTLTLNVTGATCVPPRSKQSCPEGSSTGLCQAIDKILLKNATQLKLTFYNVGGSEITSPNGAHSADVTLGAERMIAGEKITYNTTVRMSILN